MEGLISMGDPLKVSHQSKAYGRFSINRTSGEGRPRNVYHQQKPPCGRSFVNRMPVRQIFHQQKTCGLLLETLSSIGRSFINGKHEAGLQSKQGLCKVFYQQNTFEKSSIKRRSVTGRSCIHPVKISLPNNGFCEAIFGTSKFPPDRIPNLLFWQAHVISCK